MKSYKNLLEVLSKSATAAEWIHDFVTSDDPKFAGKSKEKRRQMALAAYYAKQRNESVKIQEATVKTTKHSWGTMKTIHHGADFSIPLHPEHHKEIAKLKDGQEHKFKDETGRHWTARRNGEHVHFQGANGGNSTKVSHASMKESLDLEESEKIETSDYKLSASGRKVRAKSIVFHNQDDDESNSKIKEEVKKSDIPAYLRKQQGQTPLKLSDLKRKDTISDKENLAKLRNEESKYVVHYTNDKGEHVNSSKTFDDKSAADAHASKGNAIDKVGGKYTVHKINEKHDNVPFDKPYTTTKGKNVKDKSGAIHTPMSRARDLARAAMKKQMKENFDVELDDVTLDELVDLESQNVDVISVLKTKLVAEDNFTNGEVDTQIKSYKDFVGSLNEYNAKEGRYVHKGTYGTTHKEPDDENETPKQSAEKRGRGRPKGSSSGARQKGSVKQTNQSGADYTGYKLHLPNTNK